MIIMIRIMVVTTFIIIIRSRWHVHKVWCTSNERRQYSNTGHNKHLKTLIEEKRDKKTDQGKQVTLEQSKIKHSVRLDK